MRQALLIAASGLLALATAGCGPSIEVRTLSAPDARVDAFHTFRILPQPPRRDVQPTPGTDDPMVNNSITNLALRQSIVQAFQDRGYVLDERRPDFAVAFYASATEKLDVTQWDYGYPYYPRWRQPLPPADRLTTYTEGSVVVDVIDPATRQLLWRGHGTAEVSDSPREMTKRLQQVAEKVIAAFPRATPREVAARR